MTGTGAQVAGLATGPTALSCRAAVIRPQGYFLIEDVDRDLGQNLSKGKGNGRKLGTGVGQNLGTGTMHPGTGHMCAAPTLQATAPRAGHGGAR